VAQRARLPHRSRPFGSKGYNAAMDDADIYLTKARESLLTAESELKNGRYNSCANRCYYSCFQAAIAALLREGIRAMDDRWGHDYVQAQFAGQLIHRRKRYEASLRAVLSDNRRLRDKADYLAEMVTQTQASRALNRTRGFVQAVTRKVSSNES
jgi:uncharacterized protein (UPF0332 family)